VPLDDDAGVFLRASTNNGRVETYSFTEIDRQLAVGGQFTGSRWGRPQDRWGVALAVNGLSAPHGEYLARGGLGFFLGDGRLNYATERIAEAYHRWALPAVVTRAGKLETALSAGVQWVQNPGYNRDRGPLRIGMLRLHTEF
jgi:high affinity Mn2+ porin